MGGVYCIKCNEKIRTVNSGRNYASICTECVAEIEKNMTPEDRLAHAKVGMAALVDEACGFQKTRPEDSLSNLLNKVKKES